MANIINITCPRTGRKGVKVTNLPTRFGYRQSFVAYGPRALYDALAEWNKVRPIKPRRAEIISFSIGSASNA